MLAIPGAEGMFSHIQAALVKARSSNRIKVDQSTRDKLRDWKWLAEDIATRPTSISELVRLPPSIWQATDSTKSGMGGCDFRFDKTGGAHRLAPTVLRRHPVSLG